MSNTASQPPQSSSSKPAIDSSSRATLIHNVSLGALILCPIIIALPPRKLDIYTITLLSGTFLGGNQLAHEYTGRSMVVRMQNKMESLSAPKLPEKAREMQVRLREEKMRRDGISNPGKDREEGVLAELKKKEEEKKSERGIIEKVWMGSEGDDWKAKRDQREKEALQEGRGYGGLIMDQIWEVWNWGKDKNEEVKKIDEKIVEAKEGKK